MTEIESELDTLESDYEQTKEENLTIKKSELEDMHKLEKGAYRATVGPLYWFGRSLIDLSYAVIERTAVFSYRNV
jgi:hypothetical protein